MMYHVGAIGFATTVIYLLSLYLAYTGFIERSQQRRFWNNVLLFAFISAALTGLFLALKINYRWNIPRAGNILHWHVEFGIALAFASLVHLTWHIKYFFPGKGEKKAGRERNHLLPKEETKGTGLLLLLTGFASATTQFILLREAIILGGGTEASAGIFLWLWLLLAAPGARNGGRSTMHSLKKMAGALSLSILFSLVCYLFMYRIMLAPGEIPSLIKSLFIIAVSIAPATYISAFVFIRLSIISLNHSGHAPGNSFGIETAGSVAAGLVTTVSVSAAIGNFQLYLSVLILFVTLAFFILSSDRKIRGLLIAGGAAAVMLVFVFKTDVFIRKILLHNVTIESSTDTPYGNITCGTYGGDRTVFYDHRPLFFESDIISAEENIHYALLQRKEYKSVLIISGGIRKHIPQLAKYNIGQVTYLEHDPGIIKAENARDTIINGMIIKVMPHDPIRYLKENRCMFDAVIQLIPPPSTLSLNRYYTIEYFSEVKEHLNEGALFMCTPMPYYNYSPESYRKGFSPIYKSLKGVFGNCILIPGSVLYVLASDGPLSPDISSLTGEAGIDNEYVNGYYLDDYEISRKGKLIVSQLDSDAPVNSVIRPVTAWFTNALALEMRGAGIAAVILVVVMAFAVSLFYSRNGFTMFASSAGLAGYGMIVIFILQVTVGSTYVLSAFVLSLLMAGLATGAALTLFRHEHSSALIPALLIMILWITAITVTTLIQSSPSLIIILLSSATYFAGLLTGNLYRHLTSEARVENTGKTYSADLAGAATGYLIVSTLLIPLAGIIVSAFLLGAFILLSVALVSLVFKH